VTDNGSLSFNRSDTLTFDAIVSGSGNLVQNGPGITVLGGMNTYSGGTIINNGTLLVSNSQALGLGDVVVNAGVLRTDPQPINVKGNYTQNAGGTLQLGVGGSAAGQYDFLNVTGHATLGGTLQLISLGGFQPKVGDKLTLVTAAGGISGQFASVLDPFSALVLTDLVYGQNALLLEFSGTDFAALAQTSNQLAVAKQLDAVTQDPREANLISFLESWE
jgi:autotransporter-associated beta strand protein